MSIMLMLSMIITFIFVIKMNPIYMGMMLILQTLCISFTMASMLKSFWYFYLMMLVFIGGLLILFIYVVSILPNEKFMFDQNYFMYMLFISICMLILLLIMNKMFNINLNLNELKPLIENTNIIFTNKMFNFKSNLLMISMVLYLFLCMIIVIKITNKSQGPIRKNNY